MNILGLLLAGLGAGTLGASLGIGGGVLLVPVLVLVFKIPMEDAVPASLMCVVANSCGAAASYVENRLSDVRLALSLELATVSGALMGGFVAAFLAPAWVAVAFGLFALYVSVQLWLVKLQQVETGAVYEPRNYPVGMAGSFVAGGVSAVLGVGGGPLKVPLMAIGMGVPFKIASATSNLMIGVTGVASVASYAWRGHLDLRLVAPLVLGVLTGAGIGTRVLVQAPVDMLRRAFSFVLLAVAGEMLWKGGSALWPHL